ncbi:MAG TPA: TetR/AcrR family transcriptional regulator [Anaerolineales bacterium]|nr:TetR/AcrR family transcriptional regulator [Anaerolineales bacterium]
MENLTNTTKEKILEAAIKVFAERGYHSTRVDDIADESKTSKGSIYFYFKSKQDIFLGLIEIFIDLLEKRVIKTMSNKEDHGPEQLTHTLGEIVGVFKQYRSLAKIVLIQAVGLGEIFEDQRRLFIDKFCGIVQKRLDLAIQNGSIEPIDTPLVARLWVGSMVEIVIHWIFTPEFNLEAHIPELNRYFLNSINYRSKS